MTCDRAGRFGFPEHVLSKFAAGSEQHMALQKLKKSFEEEFPQRNAGSPAPPGTSSERRVSGVPDYTIEGGAQPLDIEWQVILEALDPPDAGGRPGPGKRVWCFCCAEFCTVVNSTAVEGSILWTCLALASS